MEPITIGLIISGVVSVATLVVNLLQSAKIHNLQVSSCMKTTNNYKKNNSSSSNNNYIKKKRKKKKKK